MGEFALTSSPHHQVFPNDFMGIFPNDFMGVSPVVAELLDVAVGAHMLLHLLPLLGAVFLRAR
jgi:hypothetical protein